MDITSVESFSLDHTKVKAPYVRLAGRYTGPNGDLVSKFDLRFLQPNQGAIPTSAMHTLEHLLAIYFREFLDNVIDISPMGCRTGFYFLCFGELKTDIVEDVLRKSLNKVLTTVSIPAANEIQCGNFRDHSLVGAKAYAKIVLESLEI